ncbi:hypothetical protein EAE96_008544 [Botrytis aclada]|nr:hypothetical protein EAE96_008544 [Botrytis aclada]
MRHRRDPVLLLLREMTEVSIRPIDVSREIDHSKPRSNNIATQNDLYASATDLLLHSPIEVAVNVWRVFRSCDQGGK